MNTFQIDSNDLVTGDTMNIYLRKHKLDLTLLPNKKMIKLSDLTSSSSTNTIKIENILLKSPVSTPTDNEEEDEVDDDDDEIEDEDDDDDDDLDSLQSCTKRLSRKKREPSLKLQQRLSNEDLELIVNCVRNRQAQIYIADVKKDQYIDKILNVKLSNDMKLSNGRSEALLKKSMFPKELNTLFETFINALCGQEQLLDEKGMIKPTLTCLVVDCGFKSFSEAEIMRHIKRHLAQDGYTCPTCLHQFASMTNLQRHLRIHSGDIGKEIKCSLCDYRASTITHVKRHMAHKHLERALPCPHCSFMGATNAELKIHMARKHLELTGKNPLFLPKYLRKDYHCNICKEQYNDFKEYQTHMYEHTSSSNRFQCTECPYNCKNYSKLKRHMLYHSGARNYACELCGNKFFQMEHLKRHMQSIHNVINPPSSAQQLNLNSTKISTATNTTKKNKPLTNKKTETTIQSTKANLDQPTISITDTNTPTNSSIHQEKSYKVTSKCIYKCQQCDDYSTSKIYALNEHLLSKHSFSLNNTSNNTNLSQLISQDINFEYYDSADETENPEEQDELEQEDNLSLFNNNSIINMSCSFCNYTCEKKQTLKQHLELNHSSQSSVPILLSNDSILVNPNTKFKCGTCKLFLNSINEYITHMNEKHKIQVFLLDNPMSESSINTEEKRTENIIPIVGTTTPSITNNKKKPTVSKKQKNSTNNNRKPPIRSSNHSSQINVYNKQHYHQHNMTVRINPLIFKQQQNSQPFQISFTKHKQQHHHHHQQLRKPQLAFEMISNLNDHQHSYLNQHLIEQNNQFEFGSDPTNEYLTNNNNNNNNTHICLDTIEDNFQANK